VGVGAWVCGGGLPWLTQGERAVPAASRRMRDEYEKRRQLADPVLTGKVRARACGR
jgi:hypothetical protein